MWELNFFLLDFNLIIFFYLILNKYHKPNLELFLFSHKIQQKSTDGVFLLFYAE